MDGLREFLEAMRKHGVAGLFRGLLHVAIGRKIATLDGTPISAGVTWRQLADLLRLMRWDRDAVVELGLDPDELSPRDRQKFWYQAIAQSRVNTPAASEQADELIPIAESLGYTVSRAPGQG